MSRQTKTQERLETLTLKQRLTILADKLIEDLVINEEINSLTTKEKGKLLSDILKFVTPTIASVTLDDKRDATDATKKLLDKMIGE